MRFNGNRFNIILSIFRISATIQAQDLRLQSPQPTIRPNMATKAANTPTIRNRNPKIGINAAPIIAKAAKARPNMPPMICRMAIMVTPNGLSPEGAA